MYIHIYTYTYQVFSSETFPLISLKPWVEGYNQFIKHRARGKCMSNLIIKETSQIFSLFTFSFGRWLVKKERRA